MTGEASALKAMLSSGWEVIGFQQSITQLERASETDGYTILLQRGTDLAIAAVMYQDEGLAVTRIHFLTGEAAP